MLAAMPRPEVAAARRCLPLAAAGTCARLSFYSPRLRHPSHRHERAHVSIIVAGSLREVSTGRDEIAHASQLNLRPHESEHQVEFGPQGALILAVDLAEDEPQTTATGWLHRNLSRTQRVLLDYVLAERVACDEDVSDCMHDLLAGIDAESFEGSPPRWLFRAREQLAEDPANTRIDALARIAGVHRSHFARAFQHWFQAPPSLFRRRAMLGHAICAIASGQSLALAAATAGFADQSHLCRSMRSIIGTTPHRLLRRA